MAGKHTKGPWECGSGAQYEPVTNVYCDDALGSIVATCGHSHNLLVTREAEIANARLIAAAPDLLEALVVMEAEQSDYMTRNNLGDPAQQHAIQLARAAITRATQPLPPQSEE